MRRILTATILAVLWSAQGCVSDADSLTAVFYTAERGPAVSGELHTLHIALLDPRSLAPIEPTETTALRVDLAETPLPVSGVIRPGQQYRSEVVIDARAVRFGDTVAAARVLARFESGELTLATLTLAPTAADADSDTDLDADGDADLDAGLDAGADCGATCEAEGAEADAETDRRTERERTCQPRTCAQQGLACGEHTDGCGHTIDCGLCELDRFCSTEGRCECHFEQCRSQCCAEAQICDGVDGTCCLPNTCASLQVECGPAQDGCGHGIDCGGCPDHAGCESGACECPTGWCNAVCCAPDQTCHLDACCTRSCEGRCDGGDDGCGGTCDDCPGGSECRAGVCVECGGADEPCCASGACGALGHACGPDSGLCKPIAFLRLSPAEPASGNCGDRDYQPAGYWTTEPGLADGADEATDSVNNSRLDAGWVLLCAMDGRVAAMAGKDDCTGRETSCPVGTVRSGKWHVGTADCSGTKHAADRGGTTLLSGWLQLCTRTGTGARIELGTNSCGAAGPHCSGWLRAGAWHLGYGCEGGSRIEGASGQTTQDGWADLCLLTGD